MNTPATTAALSAPGDSVAARAAHPPGDLAIWVFILAELLAFGTFFAAYAFTREHHVALFNTMQATLDRDIGAANTVLLITASWAVARAVAAIKTNASARSAQWLLFAIACGGGFVVLKLIEYRAKFALGIDLTTNTFYMFYLSLTFFHFMHVILGMIILVAVWLKTRAGGYNAADHHGMETGASYWHMVDLAWIVLFPLVYVMR